MCCGGSPDCRRRDGLLTPQRARDVHTATGPCARSDRDPAHRGRLAAEHPRVARTHPEARPNSPRRGRSQGSREAGPGRHGLSAREWIPACKCLPLHLLSRFFVRSPIALSRPSTVRACCVRSERSDHFGWLCALCDCAAGSRGAGSPVPGQESEHANAHSACM